ncbi:TPA_asm: pentapeptide repeat-containing protein [Salmonella enterica subsp. salamae serovar 60:g,m,t:z6]|uniref:Pentapeptide repeat-containing protein n=1 Tax=Salmonella enterica subsp. houtenae serovar 1,40:z4,z32:- TaxID=1967604 RepID=A0A730ZJX8_SALHO|nr:pentapeptide repeat-containing protein [Salmonella enterica]HAC6701227.1 pentapeptide repeat-containing protein [Salmonella bongori serovar 66:z65:-]HAE2269894.1 pentapeptide repeat-containing protein [Salmonella enterica subsp. enterica serovar 1,9,12:-:-]HAE4191517.1 pentapeptide repeat-containing protein [Salmonella enterica subsp. houtenae serovar 1,40:z4,z32:-]HAE7515647.1 pentapeptide repeat-containing protein [Salmonella enterica subsp. salamae serovar 60:g,m,t:z6]HCM1946225.1 pentap
MIRIAFETNKFLGINATTLAGYDFSGMDLHRAMLNGFCLYKAIFKDAHLRNVCIEHTSAKYATFYNAALMNAFLDNSDLRGGDFRKSRPIGTHFESSVLSNSNFNGADVWHANFSNANLCGANLLFERYDGINISGVLFNKKTLWPEGFDPILNGAIYKHMTDGL